MARESMAERFARRSAEQAAEQVQQSEAPKVERNVPRYDTPEAARQSAREVLAIRMAAEMPKREAARSQAQEILSQLKGEAPKVVDLNARATEERMRQIRAQANREWSGWDTDRLVG